MAPLAASFLLLEKWNLRNTLGDERGDDLLAFASRCCGLAARLAPSRGVALRLAPSKIQ